MGTWFGMAGVRLPTHNTLKTNKMVQEKQLKELFKYIEQKWDIAVEGSHKTDIKRIFGGVLCEDIMKETEPTEQPEPKQKITPTDDDIKNGLQKLGDIIATPNPTEQPAQPSSQGKLDNSFDKERFEAMFRAVVASGEKLDFEYCKRETTYFIQQLDAYYASKNN